jgi:2-polyprenyl-3-methyl-5-hydroxy-6-metoxy-1,4-benzoquinol methylase
MQFRYRSEEKEILDSELIETAELNLNLRELHSINKMLGGYNATLAGLRKVFRSTKRDVINVLDIGFGGGDSIRVMADFAEKNSKKTFFYGVDLKPDCVAYATKNLEDVSNKSLICDDYRNLSDEFLQNIDVIHCSLFLHHLNDKEIEDLLKFSCKSNCTLLVNDLHRNAIAYYSIKFLTRLFSRSRLVKNDAPLSVLRGFKKEELEKFLKNSGYKEYSVKWIWAFRYLIYAKG